MRVIHTKLVSDFTVDKHLQKMTGNAANALFYLVVMPVHWQQAGPMQRQG